MSKIDNKQIVYINSRDRVAGTDSDFTFAINLQPNNDFDRITLLQAGIPKSYYGNQAGYNYFTLTELGVSTVCTLTPGNYNRNSLSLALTSLLKAASVTLGHNWTYVVSYPDANSQVDTGFYTFTVSGNTGQPTISFDSTTLMNELMGFNKGSSNGFTANVLTSALVVNLQPFNSIQIHSDIVANKFMQGNNTDILQSVFANVGTAPFSNIAWTCPEPESFSHELASSNTGLARFYLTDEDGIPVNTNGVNLQLVVMFWKKNPSLRLLTGFIKYLTGFVESIRNIGQ